MFLVNIYPFLCSASSLWTNGYAALAYQVCLDFKNIFMYNHGTVNSTSDYTFWTLYRSYFKGISANIELQVYSFTSCYHAEN
jgi:hypothetical protein